MHHRMLRTSSSKGSCQQGLDPLDSKDRQLGPGMARLAVQQVQDRTAGSCTGQSTLSNEVTRRVSITQPRHSPLVKRGSMTITACHFSQRGTQGALEPAHL